MEQTKRLIDHLSREHGIGLDPETPWDEVVRIHVATLHPETLA